MNRPRPLTKRELDRHPLPPVHGADKDSRGAILIIAGSRAVPGAALLAAHGAMRAGAGKPPPWRVWQDLCMTHRARGPATW